MAVGSASTSGDCIYQGWLRQCGPTKQYAWRSRWFVLTSTDLSAFRDDTQKERLALYVLRPGTQAIRFSMENAPGESSKYRSEKPFGFALDLPLIEGRGRTLHYFDAEESPKLQLWLDAIMSVVHRIPITKDTKAQAQKKRLFEATGRELVENASEVTEARELLCIINALQTSLRDKVRTLEKDAASTSAIPKSPPTRQNGTGRDKGSTSGLARSELETADAQGNQLAAKFQSMTPAERNLLAQKLRSSMGTLQAFVKGTVNKLGAEMPASLDGESYQDPYNIGAIDI